MNKGRTQRVSWDLDTVHTLTNPTVTLCVCVSIRTMKASEVKRKTMTSLAYGPCPITSLIPWKKDMGSDLGRQDSGKRTSTREWTKMQKKWHPFENIFNYCFQFISHEEQPFRLILHRISIGIVTGHKPVRSHTACQATVAVSHHSMQL